MPAILWCWRLVVVDSPVREYNLDGPGFCTPGRFWGGCAKEEEEEEGRGGRGGFLHTRVCKNPYLLMGPRGLYTRVCKTPYLLIGPRGLCTEKEDIIVEDIIVEGTVPVPR